MSMVLRQTLQELTSILKGGYVDSSNQDGSRFWSEDRDFSVSFILNLETNTITIPHACGILPDTIKTLDEIRELMTEKDTLDKFNNCINTLLKLTNKPQ